jgi:hypothetical protein
MAGRTFVRGSNVENSVAQTDSCHNDDHPLVLIQLIEQPSTSSYLVISSPYAMPCHLPYIAFWGNISLCCLLFYLCFRINKYSMTAAACCWVIVLQLLNKRGLTRAV